MSLDSILREAHQQMISKASTLPARVLANNPVPSDVPQSWVTTPLGPGIPIPPYSYGNTDEAEHEPRSFQYVPNTNNIITPRVGYGNVLFSQLKHWTYDIPEPALARRLIIEKMKNFVPQIISPKGEIVQKARVIFRRDRQTGEVRKVFTGTNELRKDGGLMQVEGLEWLTTRPDRYTPWPVWLAKFLDNTIGYDASTVYRIRDNKNEITALRVIDGSTIFCIIDERGEPPRPPAPAFAQIINGTPRNWFNTQQLWYRPRNPTVGSPYGRTANEDSRLAVDLLDNLWNYAISWYVEGNMPEMLIKAPATWTPEQASEWERVFNARMTGNYGERRRLRVIPPGFEEMAVKEGVWRKEDYEAAKSSVQMAHGVHPSETGEAPGSGLGGKGYQEEGAQSQYRILEGPIREFIEAFLTDIIQEKGFVGYYAQLDSVQSDIDPQKEEERVKGHWTSDGITLNEYRAKIGFEPDTTGRGDKYYSEAKGSGLAFSPEQFGNDGKGGPNGNGAIPEGGKEEDKGDDKTLPQPVTEKLGKVDITSHDGAMVALFMPDSLAQQLRAISESAGLPNEAELEIAEQLHLTLAYLPDAEAAQANSARILGCIQAAAFEFPGVLHGKIQGYGVFNGKDGKKVLYATLDIPELPFLRTKICEALDACGIEYGKDHGFVPHVTLAYFPDSWQLPAGFAVPDIPCEFDGVTLAIGSKLITITLNEGDTRLGKKTSNTAEEPEALVRVVERDGSELHMLHGIFTIRLERKFDVAEVRKHCGVCEGDEDYYGAPVSRELVVEFPEQGANTVEIVAMSPAGLPARPALWKPEGGENQDLNAAIGGPQFIREELAYLFDLALGFYLVPVAYATEIDGERGAVVHYVRGNKPMEQGYSLEWMERAAILDWVLGQVDRGGHNWLTHPEDPMRPILIDNGLTFPDTPRYPKSIFVDSLAEKSSGLAMDMGHLLAGDNYLWSEALEMVGEKPVAIARQRVEYLKRYGYIPKPETYANFLKEQEPINGR